MVKTFPLQYTDDYLNRIRVAAKRNNQSMKKFMMYAIDNHLEQDEFTAKIEDGLKNSNKRKGTGGHNHG